MSPRAASLLEERDGETFPLPSPPFGTNALVTYCTSVMCLIQDRIKKRLMAFEMKKQVIAQVFGLVHHIAIF